MCCYSQSCCWANFRASSAYVISLLHVQAGLLQSCSPSHTLQLYAIANNSGRAMQLAALHLLAMAQAAHCPPNSQRMNKIPRGPSLFEHCCFASGAMSSTNQRSCEAWQLMMLMQSHWQLVADGACKLPCHSVSCRSVALQDLRYFPNQCAELIVRI